MPRNVAAVITVVNLCYLSMANSSCTNTAFACVMCIFSIYRCLRVGGVADNQAMSDAAVERDSRPVMGDTHSRRVKQNKGCYAVKPLSRLGHSTTISPVAG